MQYKLITRYYDEETIIDEYDNAEDAHQAYSDADWSACHAPRDVAGDIMRITLKHGENVIKSKTY